ncbi:uncharacterized protein LOC130441698 [Diorhabda sublineata]|uniref:uncharacterized protein LOC130441698 n=1 Tax=Diorhabda sublineata TaxID=1163346 RepID=UPI0024E04E37|nr:uncharacterized protein LOC130441698 [Diorhabda sublineata]
MSPKLFITVYTAKNIIQDLQIATRKVGLKINFNKIKMMTNLVLRQPPNVDNKDIQMVESYIYLEHEIKITRDNQTTELSRGWASFGKLRDVFKGDVAIGLKRKAFNQCVLLVLTYDLEINKKINT